MAPYPPDLFGFPNSVRDFARKLSPSPPFSTSAFFWGYVGTAFAPACARKCCFANKLRFDAFSLKSLRKHRETGTSLRVLTASVVMQKTLEDCLDLCATRAHSICPLFNYCAWAPDSHCGG